MDLKIDAGWIPDLSLTEIAQIGGLKTAKNILPLNKGYQGIQDKVIFNDTAVLGTPLNGITFEGSDSIYRNYIGTSTKLYRFTKTAMTDVTRAIGGDYNASYWCFENYGDWLLATNNVDDIQVLKTLGGANFEALGGSPPKAKYMLLRHGHLILANVTEAGVSKPKKLQWCGRENLEDWTTGNLTTGADAQELPEMKGSVTGIGALGDDFVITSEGSTTIGSYLGGVYTFGFKVNVYPNIGCFYPGSFISIGDIVFFWGKDAIHMLVPGGIKDISTNRIKETILKTVNLTYKDKIRTAFDSYSGLIFWAYPSSVSTGNPDKILVYNFIEDRFTLLNIPCHYITLADTGSSTTDEQTTISIDNTYKLIDGWGGSSVQLVIVDTDSKVKTFTGNQLEAELETGEMSELPSVIMVKKMYLRAEGTPTGEVQVKHRYSTAELQKSNGTSSIKSDATADLRTSNRMFAFNIKMNNFRTINSPLTVELVKTGGR